MKKPFVAFALLTVLSSAFADVTLPPKEKFRLVLLAGQSNMCGRGTVDRANNRAHPRVVMMNRAGEWVPCVDPIHFDIHGSGVGPGKAFAEALAESDPSITVGVIPSAVGGSPVRVWAPGQMFKKGGTDWHPYDDCLARAKKAMEKGVLTAILWHQGESDCSPKGAYLHQVRLPLLFSRLRKELNAEDVPIIVGGLRRDQAGERFGKMISATETVACEYLYGPGKFVPAKDDYLLQKDGIHFTREAQQDFGRRYYEAYVAVSKALAADRNFWRRPVPADLAAKDVPPAQLPSVPVQLPEAIEKWVFPNGRPQGD